LLAQLLLLSMARHGGSHAQLGLARLTHHAFGKRVLIDETSKLFWDSGKQWTICLCYNRIGLNIPGKRLSAALHRAPRAVLIASGVATAPTTAYIFWLLPTVTLRRKLLFHKTNLWLWPCYLS
jgi:hypothetical protein